MQSSNPPRPASQVPRWSEFERANSNTILPPSFRDVTSELGASLEREGGAIADYFSAELPEGIDVVARIALLSVDELLLHELPASPDAYLVVGRHTQATVRAEAALSLSLRHVLLIPQRTESGSSIAMDVVALAPTMRIAPWPRPLSGALAGRCTALMLGDSLLLVAPVTRGEQPAEIFLAPDPAANLGVKPAPKPSAPKPRAPVEHRNTRITSAAPAQSMPVGDDIPDDARLVLEVRDNEERVRIGLREPWLVGGIVLGRNDEKCSHASLARVLSPLEVSRCHLYLRREGNDIVFYDTASTSGVCIWNGDDPDDAQEIRRLAMHAPPAALESDSRIVVNSPRTWLWLTDEVRVTLYAIGDHER